MESEKTFYIGKLALIGVGLIGGSLVQALRAQRAVGEVIGVGRGLKNLQTAKSLGVIDSFTHEVAEAVAGADMVVVATPVGAFEQVLSDLLPNLSPDAVLTDVGSVKGEIVSIAKQIMGERIKQFVPAHPVAGSENSGVMAAFPQLFNKRNIVLTPLPETSAVLKKRVEDMWRLTGALVFDMEVDLHDQVLGVTSHLPHIIVYALINYLSQQDDPDAHFQFAAGGLYDLTRIASSDAVMWRDICLNNKDKIIPIVREYAAILNQMADQIEADDRQKIQQSFEQAKQIRANMSELRESN